MEATDRTEGEERRGNWFREWSGLIAAGLFLAFCIAGVFQKYTNTAHPAPHQLLADPVWETFGQLSYKVIRKEGQSIYTPDFPEQLARLDSTIVTLSGYVIPIEAGRQHHVFLLSVLPINQCMFCGQDGIPPMAEVTLSGEATLKYTDSPVTLRGKVYLNRDDESRSEIQLRDAVPVAGDESPTPDFVPPSDLSRE